MPFALTNSPVATQVQSRRKASGPAPLHTVYCALSSLTS